MKIYALIGLSALLVACGNSPTKKADIEDGQQTDKPQNAVTYNTEQPTNYEQYRQWRAQNDPASEAYAEYKQWKISQQRWKAQNEQ